MSEPIRVVLVEDNDVFREALELLLGLRTEIHVAASVADGLDAARVVAEVRLDGVQATREVLEACPQTAVLCLTASVNAHEREALRQAGAVGCVEKDEGLDAIVAAIHDAARRAAA